MWPKKIRMQLKLSKGKIENLGKQLQKEEKKEVIKLFIHTKNKKIKLYHDLI